MEKDIKNSNILSIKDAQDVDETTNQIDICKVEFNKTWILWENYQLKEGVILDWEKSFKKIIAFNDLITFWQFWNNYPCAIPKNFIYDGDKMTYFFNEKKRIDGLNVFAEGIMPKWEDSNNNGGRIVNLLYEIKENFTEFLDAIENYWLDLVLSVIGGSIPAAKHINGIRFIDKCKPRQKMLYRFEVWLNPSINRPEEEEELTRLKDYLRDNYGSEVEDKPIKA